MTPQKKTPQKKVSVSFGVSFSVRARLDALKAQRARFTGRWASTSDLVAEAVERLLAAEGLSGRNDPNAGLDAYLAPLPPLAIVSDPDQARVTAHVTNYLAKRGGGASRPVELRTKEVVAQMGSLAEQFGPMVLLKLVARALTELGYRKRHIETGSVWVLDFSARTSSQVAAGSAGSSEGVQPVPDMVQSSGDANPPNAR